MLNFLKNILKKKEKKEVVIPFENPLLFFYGDGCEHCKNEEGIVDALKNEGIVLEKIEVWNNKENDLLLEALDCGSDNCGGIPFFYNQKTKKTLCGEVKKEEILEWAK